MRKLFRFKYEPCSGMCYAWCDKLIKELRKLEHTDRIQLVKLMVDAHNKLCDNPAYSFGVDTDRSGTVFVAHFRTPDKTDLYYSGNFEEVVKEVCSVVLKTNIPTLSGDCVFGDNGAEDLGHEILKYCQDEFFFTLEERHCECKTHMS